MLGGYYLGQLYLGISGLPAAGTLSVQSSSHQLSSDNITLTQKHSIVVSNTTHGLSSGNLDLVEHKTLSVSNAYHGHTAQGITLAVRSYLDVSNAIHGHSANNVAIAQRHYLIVSNGQIAHTAESLGGLINLEPFGLGGGFGAVDGFGIVAFGSINIELPIHLYIFADDSHHSLPTDSFEQFIQIFNMVRTGEYKKDFGDSGSVGSEYTKATGTMPSKNGSFGQITPVSDSNQGFLILDVIPSGSYTESAKDSGIISKTNSSDGSYLPDEEDTGNYVKIK